MIAEEVDAPSRSPSEITELTAAAIAAADARINAAVRTERPTFEGLFGALDDAARAVAVAFGQGAFLKSVDPDDAVRAAADAADERIAKWRAGVSQREDVAAAIGRFADTADLDALDDQARAFVRRWQTDVRQSGASLPAEVRAEVKRHIDRLIELQTTFAANLLVTDHVELRRDQLDGVAEAVIRTLEPGTTPGTVDAPINEAVAMGILERARDRSARESVDRARLNRGGPDNLRILDEVVIVRRQLAQLLGYRSWLELRAENLAAPDGATIERFIDDMVERLEVHGRSEMATMRELLAAEAGAPVDLVMEDWDWRYAEATQRAAAGVRPEDLEDYLELETVLQGLMSLSERIFGIRVIERPERAGWHPSVRAFDLRDRETDAPIGRLFVDPYVREGKAGNPFMDVLDPGLRGPSGVVRPPVMALIISAPEPTDGPSLIGTTDVDSLFHEYGHVIDFALEPSPYVIHRPDLWIPMDWIEGPSGFLGRWGRHPDVIAAFGRHHETGAPIPANVLEPLDRAEALNVALRQLRWLSMAKLDLLIHGEEPISVTDALRRTWPMRGTPYPEGTVEPAGIPHLLSGYDCAIYGWVWATALSDDLLSRFEADGMTSPELGMAYRRQILEVPWTADPLEAHAAFMGRPWSIDALIARVARSHGQVRE